MAEFVGEPRIVSWSGSGPERPLRTINKKGLRQNLRQITTEIREDKCRYVVESYGTPEIVILSTEDYEALVEAKRLLSDPAVLARLQLGFQQIQDGDGEEILEDKECTRHRSNKPQLVS